MASPERLTKASKDIYTRRRGICQRICQVRSAGAFAVNIHSVKACVHTRRAKTEETTPMRTFCTFSALLTCLVPLRAEAPKEKTVEQLAEAIRPSIVVITAPGRDANAKGWVPVLSFLRTTRPVTTPAP